MRQSPNPRDNSWTIRANTEWKSNWFQMLCRVSHEANEPHFYPEHWPSSANIMTIKPRIGQDSNISPFLCGRQSSCMVKERHSDIRRNYSDTETRLVQISIMLTRGSYWKYFLHIISSKSNYNYDLLGNCNLTKRWTKIIDKTDDSKTTNKTFNVADMTY